MPKSDPPPNRGLTAGVTIASILTVALQSGDFTPGIVLAGALTAASGAIINKLTARTDADDTLRAQLAATLHNEHLALAAAAAVEHTLLAAEGGPPAKKRAELAAATARYWLQLQKQRDPRTAAYAESALADRLTEYLTHPPADPLILLPEWKAILLESAVRAEPRLALTDLQANALAGHLCRHFPGRLYTAFKSDLETGGAAFGGMVLRLLSHTRDELRQLRDELRQDLAAIKEDTGLLVERSDEQLDLLRQLLAASPAETARYRKTIAAFTELPGTLAQTPPVEGDRDGTQRVAAAYATLENRHALPSGALERELPGLSAWLLARPDLDPVLHAQALFVQQHYARAAAYALEAEADLARLQEEVVQKRIQLLRIAADSEYARIADGHAVDHYYKALEHYRSAAALTSQEREPREWARHQHSVAGVLGNLGQMRAAEEVLREVLAVRECFLGSEYPDTLLSRSNLANVLKAQGRSAEAEAEHRAVLAVRERVLGPEHPDSLASRNNLANALYAQGRSAEAEAEHRARIAIEERVLGSEHPGTLSSRNNLANALRAQGRSAEAEAEHRAVLAVLERVLGPEHPDSLASRNNLANTLHVQGRYVEAEVEYRAVLAMHERVMGAEHPDVFCSCFNLALALEIQGKIEEAREYVRRALEGGKRVMGVEHPDVKDCQQLVDRLKEREADGR